MYDKPKIAFLISDTNAGGTANSTGLLIRNTDRNRFHVIVLACGTGPVAEQLRDYGDEYHNLHVGSWPQVSYIQNNKRKASFFLIIKLIFWFFKCSFAVAKWCRCENIDIIHSNSPHFNIVGGIASRLAGVKSVWHIRGPLFRRWFKGGPFLFEGRLALLFADRFIANSRFTAHTFHPSWKNKARIIYNAIDVSHISANQHPGELRKMAGIPAGKKVVGNAAVIEDRKGLDRFIETAALIVQNDEHVDFIIIAGIANDFSRHLFEKLNNLVAKKQLTSRFFFVKNLRCASEYFSDMDAFFMCSRPGTETFGLVVTEAMAAGVPVVAFANDAMPEIIDDGKTGILVNEADCPAAAREISRILHNPEFSKNLAEAAQIKVYEQFDTPILAKCVNALYEEMLAG